MSATARRVRATGGLADARSDVNVIGNNYSRKRVLVTGGAGFIGSHVVDRLAAVGADVTVVDDLSAGRRGNLRKARGVRVVTEDVARLESALDERFDVIFHIAANASVPKSVEAPRMDFHTNAEGTLSVLEYARRTDSGPIVYASTAAVYGEPEFTPITEAHPLNPVSPYGASKLAGERLGAAYEKTYGMPFHAVRVFNTYGPRQPRYVMHDLIVKLMANPRDLDVLGSGDQVRDYCYVSDMVDAFLLVGENGGGPYNAAGGAPVSIREVTERLVRLVAPGARVRYGSPSWRGDINVLVASVERLKRLGFTPRVPLDEGLRRLYASMRREVPQATTPRAGPVTGRRARASTRAP